MSAHQYKVVYTSMKCYRESDESTPDDEIYALFAIFEPDKSLNRVVRTKLYINVDAGENKGTYNTSDNRVIIDWNSRYSYNKLSGVYLPTVFMVMLEHDETPVDTFVKNLNKDIKKITTTTSFMRKVKERRWEGASVISGYIQIDNPDDIVAAHSFPMKDSVERAIGTSTKKSRKEIIFDGKNGEGKYKLRFSIYARS